MEDLIPSVSLADFKDEELKMIESASSNLLKLAICSEKEDNIRRSYIAKHMLALETKKNKKNKPPLPFNLNLKPRTCRKPRSTPFDIRTLLPYLHQMRKSSHNSPKLGSSNSSSQSLRLCNTKVSQEFGSSSYSSQNSRLCNTKVSQEFGSSSSSSSQSSRLCNTKVSQEFGSSSSSSSQSSRLCNTQVTQEFGSSSSSSQSSRLCNTKVSQEFGSSSSSYPQSSRLCYTKVSQEFGSSSSSSQSSRLCNTQVSQEFGSSSSSSQSSRLCNTKVSQEFGSSSSSSQSSRLCNTKVSQEFGSSSSSSSQSSRKLRFTIRVKPPVPQPELPLDFKKKIAELGGSDPRLVFVKTLFTCDVDSYKSRLTLPYKQCRVDLGDTRNKPVKMIYRPDDEVKEMMMKLNKWDTVSSYVFNGSWNELVNLNHLKVKDVVQVWCFRVKDEMSFALVKL